MFVVCPPSNATGVCCAAGDRAMCLKFTVAHYTFTIDCKGNVNNCLKYMKMYCIHKTEKLKSEPLPLKMKYWRRSITKCKVKRGSGVKP